MGVILALVSTIIDAFSTGLRKRALILKKISHISFFFLGSLGGLIISILFVIISKFDYSILSKYGFLILVTLITVLSFLATRISQDIYKEEKLSVLMPFEQINKVITVIISFFLFKNSSIITLIIAILTIIVITVFSLDFKEFRLPKNFFGMLKRNLIVSAQSLLASYLVMQTDVFTYYSVSRTSSAILVFIVILMLGKIPEFKTQNSEFYKNRFGASFIGAIPGLIGIFILKQLGLVVSTILGFMSIITTLVFSFIMFGDKPSKKDILLSIIVSAMIALGFMFK